MIEGSLVGFDDWLLEIAKTNMNLNIAKSYQKRLLMDSRELLEETSQKSWKYCFTSFSSVVDKLKEA